LLFLTALLLAAVVLLIAGALGQSPIDGTSWTLVRVAPPTGEAWTGDMLTEGVGGTLTFGSGNRFTLTVFGIAVSGNYEKTKDGATLTMDGTGHVAVVTISKDTLILVKDGSTMTFSRYK
jgi:hypothetical protein